MQSSVLREVYEVRRAKDIGAFVEGLYYHDYEFAITCILMDELTGYIRAPGYLERRHPGQDGRTSYRNAYQGTLIFDRIHRFGSERGFDAKTMGALRFRGFTCFTRGFLLPNWLREQGNSPGSLLRFMGELRGIHRRLPMAVLLDPYCMGQFLTHGTGLHDRLVALVRYLRSRPFVSALRKRP